MSAEENKAIIRHFVETVWNEHDTTAVGEFHADEFTLNGEPTTASTFAADLAGLLEFYSDLHETIEAMVAEDDRVAYRWTMAGTDPRNGERHVDESAGRWQDHRGVVQQRPDRRRHSGNRRVAGSSAGESGGAR